MPKANLEYINKLVGNNTYLTELIVDILTLEFRIEHHDTDSLYFNSGLVSQKVQLEELTTKLKKLKATVNSISLSLLISSLKI